MNVVDSDVSYLGCNAAESYALSWKVLLPNGSSQFSICNVYGNVTGSRIHDCYYGFYSWGGQDADHGQRV